MLLWHLWSCGGSLSSGKEARAPRWPFEMLAVGVLLCLAFHPCPACKIRRRELRDWRIASPWGCRFGYSLLGGRGKRLQRCRCLLVPIQSVFHDAAIISVLPCLLCRTVPPWVDPLRCSTPDFQGGSHGFGAPSPNPCSESALQPATLDSSGGCSTLSIALSGLILLLPFLPSCCHSIPE